MSKEARIYTETQNYADKNPVDGKSAKVPPWIIEKYFLPSDMDLNFSFTI